MASGLDSLFTKESGLDVRNGSVFAALPPSPPPLVVVVAVVVPAAVLNSFNRSLKTATVPLASSPLSSQHCTNSAFFIELNRVTGPAPLDDDDDAGAAAFPSPPNAARSMSSHSFALKNIGAVKIGGSTFNTFSVGRFFTRERKNSNAKNPAKLRKADTRKDTHTQREREREKEKDSVSVSSRQKMVLRRARTAASSGERRVPERYFCHRTAQTNDTTTKNALLLLLFRYIYIVDD